MLVYTKCPEPHLALAFFAQRPKIENTDRLGALAKAAAIISVPVHLLDPPEGREQSNNKRRALSTRDTGERRPVATSIKHATAA